MTRNTLVSAWAGSTLLAVGLAAVGAGCIATPDPTRSRMVQEPPETGILEEKIRRLEGDTESAMLQVNDLRRDLERAHNQTTGAVEARLNTMVHNLDSLQQRIAALEAAREQDKQEIVDRLSAKIAGLMSQQQAASEPVRTSSRRTSEYGYEHTVESGQTLSAIAAAYGVSTRAIIDANNLTNPNQLRVGQKLFIPE